jgi:CRP/FNR family transcriptional regulator, cyclic AMP receptor protein
VDVPESFASGVLANLPETGWFADCSPDLRREILALARLKSLAAGSVVFRAGDVGGDLFRIVSGVVTVQCRFTHQDAVLMHMMWPGEWFGTMEVMVERKRNYTAIARTDVTLLRMPGNELQELLRRRPEGIIKLGRHAVYGFDLAMQGAADLLIRDASARCAAVLLRLAGRRWDSGPEALLAVEIPAPQSELAMLCNVSRSTFSRVMQDFSRRQLVTLNYSSLTLNDPAQLRAVVEAG